MRAGSKATPLRDLPEEELFARLATSIERSAGAVRESFLAAVAAAVAAAPHGATQAEVALLAGLPEMLDAAVDWPAFERRMLEAYRAGGPIATAFLRGARIAPYLLDPADRVLVRDLDMAERAQRWLSRHGAERVTVLSAQSKAGLREVLVGAWNRIDGEGQTIDQARRRIRDLLRAEGVGPFAGLNERQARGFANQIAAWTADPEVSEKRLAQLVRNRHKKLTTSRGELIAKAELYAAGNQGLLEAWEAGEEAGGPEVRAGEFVDRVGVTVDGARIHPRVRRPPLHPHCHCALRLVSAGETADGRRVYRVEWATRLAGVCDRCREMDRQLAARPRLELA